MDACALAEQTPIYIYIYIYICIYIYIIYIYIIYIYIYIYSSLRFLDSAAELRQNIVTDAITFLEPLLSYPNSCRNIAESYIKLYCALGDATMLRLLDEHENRSRCFIPIILLLLLLLQVFCNILGRRCRLLLQTFSQLYCSGKRPLVIAITAELHFRIWLLIS